MKNSIGDTKNIGDGKFPNFYYVYPDSSFLVYNKENNVWNSNYDEGIDSGKIKQEGKMFKTYSEAKEYAGDIINEMKSIPGKNSINSVYIEDRLSGEVYMYSLTAKQITEDLGLFGANWKFDFLESEDIGYTKKTMEKNGYDFE